MKINVILPGIGVSGGNRVIFEYANRLSERGHDVTILYPAIPTRMGSKLANIQERANQVLETAYRSIFISDIDWFDINVPIKKIPTLSQRLIEYTEILIPDADITVASSWQTAYTVSSLSECKGEKAYFVQHYEIWETWDSEWAWEKVSRITDSPTDYPIKMHNVVPPNKKDRKKKEIVDKSYRLDLSVITISSWLSELMEMTFDKEVVSVIPNSVNTDTFYPEETETGNETSILIPFRDSKWKGKKEAIDLIAYLNTGDVEIHTYGPGNKSELPPGVTHHSRITDDELRRLYSQSDIFVLTTWVEGFGLPPLEAMACKCAVVATNVGAVPDYIDSGKTGIIVPPRDSSNLIEAVDKLIGCSEKIEELKEQGYRSVRKYTWSDAAKQFEESLQEIVHAGQ